MKKILLVLLIVLPIVSFGQRIKYRAALMASHQVGDTVNYLPKIVKTVLEIDLNKKTMSLTFVETNITMNYTITSVDLWNKTEDQNEIEYKIVNGSIKINVILDLIGKEYRVTFRQSDGLWLTYYPLFQMTSN